MRTKMYSILIGILSFYSVFSQNYYSDYNNKKEEVFYDGFNNNNNNWLTYSSSSSYYGYFEDGYYYWESKKGNSVTTTQDLYLDNNKDFEIEGRFKRVSGEKTTTLQSLLFGCSTSKRYFFGFTGDGSYRISKYDGSDFSAIKDWTSSSYIKKTDQNKLTVRKVGSKYYFFINEKFVYSTSSISLYGNKIGFQAATKTNLKIDYLRVSYLEKSYYNTDKTSYYTQYKDYIYTDDFYNNDNEWSTGSSGKSDGYMENGSYNWKSLVDKAWSTSKSIYINQNRDFEIEAEIKYVSGKTSSGIMLQWGRDGDTSNNFNIEFNAAGKYWIGKYYNKNYDASKKWTLSNTVKKYDYNKLTVRKIGNRYYFFINEKYLHSMTYTSFYGNRIGFTTPGNTHIRVRNLKVAYIDGKGK